MSRACVIITTKNRRDELANALRSAIEQRGDVEVMVVDDGSTDGTADLVRQQFPSARLERSEQSQGYLPQRNRAASLASAEILFSIDDDAVFSTPDVIAQTLRDFDDPRIAAIAIPYIDVLKGPQLRQAPPQSDGTYITREFRGTAYAIRREVFIQMGGFCEALQRQLEEQEFCARLLDAGYIVRLGRSDPIHHKESPYRDRSGIFYYWARNSLLFCWFRAPASVLAMEIARAAFRRWRRGLRHGYGWASFKGIIAGLAAMRRLRQLRHPVRRSTWHLLAQLRRSPMLLDEVGHQLLPIPRRPDRTTT